MPPDEDLLGELGSVRLRKNTLGIYRLDHDSGQHDDQAVALVLGVHHLLGTDPAPEFTVFADDQAPAAAPLCSAWRCSSSAAPTPTGQTLPNRG